MDLKLFYLIKYRTELLKIYYLCINIRFFTEFIGDIPFEDFCEPKITFVLNPKNPIKKLIFFHFLS